jgi:hypothetical protein
MLPHRADHHRAMTEKQSIPRWQKIAAVGVYVLLVAASVVFHSRLTADMWPPDASRIAPNLVASVLQAAIVFPFLVLLWPPTRRRLHRFADLKLRSVHDKLDARHAEARAHEEWTVCAIHALHHGEPLPDHPHFSPRQPPSTERIS